MNWLTEDKEYQKIIFSLNGFDGIDQFIIDSLKYFLNRSDDFDIRCICNEALFYQLAVLISTPDHLNVAQILIATYEKKTLGKIFNIIKQEAINNLNEIKHYIQHDLLILTSHSEIDTVMEQLEVIYNNILEIHYELSN